MSAPISPGDRIAPSATLTGIAVELPEAKAVPAWTEAGGNPTKVIGHVMAAPKLDIAWRRSVGKGSSNKGALTTPPVTSETMIYTLDAAQTVRASSLSNGAEVWSKKLRGISKRDKAALGGGLAVAGDTLVVASGYGYVMALDAATGDQKWRRDLGAPMTGSPGSGVRSPPWLPFVWADYWVLYLDDDYTRVAVGTPDRDYLWILSRTPQIADDEYRAVVGQVEEMGYAVERLERTRQTR